MRALRFGLASACAIVFAIPGSAYARVAPAEGCFGCKDGLEAGCESNQHKDSDTGSDVTSPNQQHGGCVSYSCFFAHYPYNLSAVDQPPSDARSERELRALAGRVIRAVANDDDAELAALVRGESRVRINFGRQAIQVVGAKDVAAHATLPSATINAILAHH